MSKSCSSRVAVTRLDGPADTEVEGEPDDVRAVSEGDRGGRVPGAVVDDEHLEGGVGGADLFDHAADTALLVEGGDDGETPLHPRRNRPSGPFA